MAVCRAPVNVLCIVHSTYARWRGHLDTLEVDEVSTLLDCMVATRNPIAIRAHAWNASTPKEIAEIIENGCRDSVLHQVPFKGTQRRRAVVEILNFCRAVALGEQVAGEVKLRLAA